jgi:hypothetical protein
MFYGEELLAPRPTPKLEGHPLSAVRDCLFNIFAATLHTWRVSPPSATWGRDMLWWQGTHLTWKILLHLFIILGQCCKLHWNLMSEYWDLQRGFSFLSLPTPAAEPCNERFDWSSWITCIEIHWQIDMISEQMRMWKETVCAVIILISRWLS